MKQQFYYQCCLTRGTTQLTTWVPEQYAHVNKKVTVGDDLLTVWTVKSVYRWTKHTKAEVNNLRQRHTRWRQHTDV
ncbi:MAG: hypothetical protein ACXABY_06350 [Candidatus Thorarchaeota archaeon]